MVKDTRAATGVGDVRALNRPQAIEVRADGDGQPAALKLRRSWVKVESVADRWRIDDEWWRERPVSRTYYGCVVDQGLRVVVYHDLTTGEWYQQAP